MTETTSNPWIDRVTTHAVHASLRALAAAADAAEERAKDEMDALASANRVRAAFARAAAYLADSEPSLIQAVHLDSINNNATSAIAELSAYASNGNGSHLTNANQHADAVLVHTVSLPTVRAPSDVKALNDAIASFHQAVDKHVAGLRAGAATVANTLETLRAQMSALDGEISTQKARLDTAISQFQQQGATAEAERTTSFGQSELARQAQAAAAEEQRRAQYAAAADERKASFDTILEETSTAFTTLEGTLKKSEEDRSKQFTASAEAQRKAMEELSAELKKSAEAVVAQIEAEKVKAEKIVHVVGNTGMVGGYQRTANEERAAAKSWSNVTVGAMLILIAAAVLTLLTAPPAVTWPYLAIRAFVATAVAILATYAGRRAGGHRDEERRLRRMELEMASIDPYLALLPEPDRNAVKKLLAEKWFAQPDGAREAEKTAPTGSVVDLAKAGFDTVKSGFDAVKNLTEGKK